MSIRLLSSEVASQIAAGEVIERPASVVKELIENALDADAKSLAVTIAEAGRKLIEVADDGSGIVSDELALAVSRHATSKLTRADDLFHISTLGFRGEALASIGSVSRMTITSKTEQSKAGARIRVEGGREGKVESIGAPTGSVVRVEDLFYNVPARLKFLKTDVTERRAIDALITRYALAYPDVRFKLAEGNNVTLQTAGDGDRRSILAALYGVDVAKQLLEINAEEDGIKLSGYVSPTAITRSNRKDITFFVNGRWVQDTPLTTALIQAYHTLLMVGRYPLAAMFVEINPEEVDVNVHPAKAEVRFRNQDRVFSFVQRAVRRGLLAYAPVPSVTPSLWGGSRPQETRQVGLDWTMAHDEQLTVDGGQLTAASELSTTNHQLPTTNRVPLLRLIGQIGSTYLVAEGPDGLYLIDQHAAHERVLFEKLMAQHDMKKIPSQSLLTPVAVTLPPQSANLLISQLPTLAHFGFEVEDFGSNSFQVRAMPVVFAGGDPSAALRAVVEDFEEDEAPLQNEIEKKLAARVCKRLAVKGGQTLSPDEQRALLTDLENCDSPRTCPHGRPTMIHLSVDMLERQFGRRGAR
ncbi:MAG: DNA mismatch repair endonuclease MutL [Chloroflexi bacterium]|nr:DNA mismatch repair endonuclease MutL [Chloroflexota bacterium]MBI3339126.1 DNA mismatch repair endonuclease MutL [Chloroflexota bacterium]